MKVLHLTTHLNVGGITTYILRLVRPLKKLGIETFVLSSGGECTPQFEERGARVFRLPIRTKSELHPCLYLNLPALKKIVLENKIDLLHAHTRVTQVMAFWLQQSMGIDFVTTCHGYYKRRLGRRLLPAWGKRAIAISQGVADHLAQDFKLSPDKIKTVLNGVDVEEMDACYARHSSRAAKIFYGFQPGDYDSTLPNRILKTVLEENKIVYADPLSCLKQSKEEQLYYIQDNHLTSKGHKIIASCLYPALDSFLLANSSALKKT